MSFSSSFGLVAMSLCLSGCSGPSSLGDKPGDTDDTVDTADTGDSLPPQGDLTVEITPVADVVEQGLDETVEGTVVATVYDMSEIDARWVSSIDGLISEVQPDSSGLTTMSTAALSAGWHDITLEVTNPAGQYDEDTELVGICEWADPHSFDTNISGSGWQIFGDAYWDTGGWLEMTGNMQSKHGAIYLTDERINPGSADIRFKIWTGGGINGGADGFAMNIINVPTVSELTTVVNSGQNGGCLGYGVSGDCGSLTIDSFHIEFDTWRNNGDVNTDPTTQNHVGVMLDGDATNHYLWAEIPTLEDQQWHEVMVVIDGTLVQVSIDGFMVVDGSVPALAFEGGYIGFSGTTGWATNYHRFDDLQIIQECLVPE
jgi:hypothetical protein